MIDLRGRLALTSAFSALLLATCGDGGTCGKVLPCGGDVTGSWAFTSACVDNAVLNMQLAQGTCTGAMAHPVQA